MFAEVSVPLFSVSFEDLVLFDVGSCLVALLNVWVHLCWKERNLFPVRRRRRQTAIADCVFYVKENSGFTQR